MREALIRLLTQYGYSCDSSDDYPRLVSAVLSSQPDLVLLDINLPYQDGFEVCRALRRGSAVPILVLTSRATDFDELLSLNLGADDFITKPYNAQVLLARMQKLLSRARGPSAGAVLVHGGLTLNLLTATISHDGREESLTRNELGILRLLMAGRGNILPRDAIINALWQSEAFIDENTLNVNIVRLRRKLASVGLAGYLKTKRGLGYYV